MKLKGIINDLNENRDRRDEYSAVILVRNQEVSADANWNLRYYECQIIDIHVDHDNSEIDLIIDPQEQTQNGRAGFLLPAFSERLQNLPERCREYSLCVGHWMLKPHEEVTVRVDVDIIGVLISKAKLVFGLIQWHNDCQEEFKKR